MNNPLVSVILPCYNASLYVEEALHSVINQTYKNLEILAIDDGSSDDTLEILKKLSFKDKRIKIIRNESNLGLIKSLNKAILLAKGDFVARMDADDISHLSRFSKQVDFLNRHHEIDIISSSSSSIDVEGNVFGLPFMVLTSKSAVKFMSLIRNPMVHGSIMSRRSVFKNQQYSNLPKAIYTEDYELWMRLFKDNCQFANINEVLYYYRKNPKGVSAQNSKLQFTNSLSNSIAYASEYLNQSIPISTYQLATNKIIYPYTFVDIWKANRLLNNMLKIFRKKECVKKNELEEIYVFLNRQKIDFLGQVIIKGHLLKKLSAFVLILLNPVLFLDKNNITYILSKRSK